ncbi:MAG: MotA/TolQ/ExbB proton channel family protein [Deltaproteobacteria bacterium]|nr:MotA/TolQ/ExbB proton channel family protein [Deltaproteobacteria bacterium]
MFEAIAIHYQEGGWGMYPITVCLCFILSIAFERIYFTFFKASIEKDAFVQQMRKYILAGNVGKALALCSQNPTPLSNIIKAGLVKVNKSDAEVQAAMDEASLREIPQIDKRTAYLAMLANVAMLAGLLGTISGLITCFSAVATADPAEKATLLAKGIAEAMNCTAFGLITAIPGLVFYGIVQGKSQKLSDDINEASVSVLNLIVTNRDKLDLSTLGAGRED